MKVKQFPIGIWNYAPIERIDEARVEEWAECGLTLPMSPEFRDTPADVARMKQILDWADARGMQVIVCDPRTADFSNPRYADSAARAAADFGSHPACFAFRVLDEPGEAEWKATADACPAIRKAAPGVEPFVNHLPWYDGVEKRVGFPSFEEYLDTFIRRSGISILCYDCYSQMLPDGAGLPMYWRNLETYRAMSLKHQIPFWNTILSVGHFHYRCPSEDDMRWQFYTTIAYGAKGILYFFFYMRMPHDNYRLAPIDELWDRTPMYYTLKRLNRGFLRKWGKLMLELSNVSVTHWPEAPIPQTRVWQPGRMLEEVWADKRHLLLSEFVDGQSRPYFMVVNNSTTESTYAVLGFSGEQTRAFVRDWDGNEAEVALRRENGLSRTGQWLCPGQMEVYRVEGR